ncbi:MAG: carbonic anhydrase [Hyphomonadaceae bacterium]
MEHLLDGYRRYRGERWPQLRALHQKLAQGQRPRVLVIACCDSRVDPATIFDADPGELFVIRNVANLAPPFELGGGYHGTSAAIEFAVTGLKVETILVLGHAQCGGVAAALAREEGDEPSTFLDHWVGLLDPAKERIAHVQHDQQSALEYESIKVTLENLTSFPFIAKRVADGRLKLRGARYGVADGLLELYDAETDTFSTLDV